MPTWPSIGWQWFRFEIWLQWSSIWKFQKIENVWSDGSNPLDHIKVSSFHKILVIFVITIQRLVWKFGWNCEMLKHLIGLCFWRDSLGLFNPRGYTVQLHFLFTKFDKLCKLFTVCLVCLPTYHRHTHWKSVYLCEFVPKLGIPIIDLQKNHSENLFIFNKKKSLFLTNFCFLSSNRLNKRCPIGRVPAHHVSSCVSLRTRPATGTDSPADHRAMCSTNRYVI